MAGSPTCGKMSIGIRWIARIEHNATAMMATTTVMGRERASRTRRICWLPVAQWARSLTHLREERLKIASGRRDAQQAAPDSQTGQCFVDLGLREQPLRLRHLVDVCEPGWITSRRLTGGGAGSGYLDR